MRDMAACAGHLHLPPLLSGLCKEQAERLVVRMSNFYDNHQLDCGESVMLAYTSKSYTKARLPPEYIFFAFLHGEIHLEIQPRTSSFLYAKPNP